MLFSQDKNNNDTPPKKRSAWGYMLNPDIKNTMFRPVADSVRMFVRLIAMIFVANKLLPKDHPGLADPNDTSLTMTEIISTAWSRLSFTKQGLPQVILFAAVVGCLVFSALFVILFVLSLASGTAHAADGAATSMFSSDESDIAHQWIGYLFKGKEMDTLINAGFDVYQSQNIQTALKTALGFFSKGILVFAGIILMYHLTVMIAETAHTGKVMGNANQVWAPIRLVFAIGLLVPIGDAGLNTAQYAVIQIADWGSGFASQTWKVMLDSVAVGKGSFVAPATRTVADVVKGVARIYVCKYAYNKYLDNYTYNNDKDKYTIPDDGVPLSFGALETTVFQDKTTSSGGNCGGFSFNGGKDVMSNNTADDPFDMSSYFSSSVSLFYNSNTQAFIDMKGKVSALVDKIAPVLMNEESSGTSDDNTIETTKELYQIVKDYRSALTQANEKMFTGDEINRLADKWSKWGWITAGAWFNTIAATQSLALTVSREALPEIKGPNLVFYAPYVKSPEQRTSSVIAKFDEWMEVATDPSVPITQDDLKLMGSDASFNVPKGLQTETNDLLKTFVDAIIWIPSVQQIFYGNTGKKLGADGNSKNASNPLSELAAYGQASIAASFDVLEYTSLVLAGAKGMEKLRTFLKNRNISETDEKYKHINGLIKEGGAAVLGGLAGMIATVFFTVGITLGYILPLLPFTIFFFNVLAWVVSLFEAVVSMPLFALAHLTTKGEGLPGDMAKQGYFFIFSIFLRPALMVIGLVAALLVFFVAIAFLNLTFDIAASSTGALNATGSFWFFSKLIFFVLYCFFAYICATTCFKTISFFPEHSMKWMNSQGVSTERMGNKGIMSTASQAMTAYGFKETIAKTTSSPVATTAMMGIDYAATGAGVTPSSGTSNQINPMFLSKSIGANAHTDSKSLGPENKDGAPEITAQKPNQGNLNSQIGAKVSPDSIGANANTDNKSVGYENKVGAPEISAQKSSQGNVSSDRNNVFLENSKENNQQDLVKDNSVPEEEVKQIEKQDQQSPKINDDKTKG